MIKASKHAGSVRRVACVAAVALGVSIGGGVQADDAPYPSQPVTLMLAYPPGGGVDLVGRLLARGLEKSLGQVVVVENRPGAGSMIGTNALIRAKPDGYTLLLADPALVINETLMPNATYKVQRDLVPISTITLSPLVLAVPTASNIQTLDDLIAAGKSGQSSLNYASAGLGSTPHMSGELLKLRTGGNFTHIPYKGSGPAMTDLISGQVDFAFATQPAASSYIASGRLRGLATTGSEPSKLLPDLKPVAATIPDFRVLFWTALVAPAGTPPAVIDKLNAAVKAAMATPEMQSGLEKAGENPSYMTPAKTAAFMQDEATTWARVTTEGHIKAN